RSAGGHRVNAGCSTGASKTDRAPAEDVPGLDLSNHTDDLLSEAGPLLTASVCGHVEVVDLLLRAGADPNAVDWSETPPLVGAAAQGHLRVIDRLLTAGARVDAGTGFTALEEAVVNGHADVVRRLLRADADVDRRNEDGGTVLMLAAATGCLPIVRLLVEAGADVNATTDGEAALSCAASYGQLSVYAYLLPKSDPSVQARGDVALMAYLEYVARM
ncbi:MAG: ankyrin repeat domain-containing protein, partial [Myxococcota bacterium]